jgi:flagellin-like protein
MESERRHDSESTERANRGVSPVIGVILMVAITVILAAVIGAFVLEIGDQQETAPSTSFDTEQQTLLYQGYCGNPCGADVNLTTVDVSHAGGETIDVSQVAVKVDGNESTYGSITNTNANKWSLGYPDVYPVPDFVPTLGTNQQVEFESGQSWRIHSVSGEEDGTRFSHAKFKAVMEASGCGIEAVPGAGGEHFRFHKNTMENCGSVGGTGHRDMVQLEQGRSVNVVWSAESGGKTQTLFKYEVQ